MTVIQHGGPTDGTRWPRIIAQNSVSAWKRTTPRKAWRSSSWTSTTRTTCSSAPDLDCALAALRAAGHQI